MGVWKWLCFSYERENYKGAEVLKIFYGDFFFPFRLCSKMCLRRPDVLYNI